MISEPVWANLHRIASGCMPDLETASIGMNPLQAARIRTLAVARPKGSHQ